MLKIIAAVADNGVIGRDGKLPWRLPDDMIWFKDRTGTEPVVMGMKTFNSLPAKYKPLPGRENVILTRDRYNAIPEVSNVTFVHELEDVVKRSETEDLWVIGGAQMYRELLPYSLEMYLTRVHSSVEGDVLFPEWNRADWILGWQYSRGLDERHPYARTWEIYFRDTPIYQFANTRTNEQRQEMREGLENDICPFCYGNLGLTHKSPILNENEDWVLTANDYPYKGTEVHLLIIPKRHMEHLSEVTPSEWVTFSKMLSWAETECGIVGGGFAWRFGNPLRSGGTIHHMHAHLIMPSLGKMAAFTIGCFKTSLIEPPALDR